MNIRIVVLLFLMTVSFRLKAQDVTVYNSPHNLDNTISKLYFSIDKNGFSYVNTQEYKSNPRGLEDGFKGRIQVISFETDDVVRLAACEPAALLDVPFKILVWEEGDDTFIAFTNAMNLKHRYVIRNCDEVIHEINKALIRIVNDAIRTH
ncbi:Uncharacterized conserved protein, DUF302 family [Reichenbachiella faecimaris]|uniref:Uncharacterized conserved protein, DUF302 family n=1 Tax=Reichenbachiella faecimaris TaxID=692418 RepID=A0A1W2GR79_REIFA|nr:hypothetical protein [Reichenbachiella faecimaris]SMD38922.1 Uncharacterized conserved protein, DUF302 family [Reichenbachiella faecimaris]